MASSIISLSNRNFGGIRRKNSRFDDTQITCSDCQNVELYFTESNSGVGLRTAKGNKVLLDYFAENEEIIEVFETIQLGTKYLIAYTILEGEGRLYKCELDTEQPELLVSGLNGLRMASGCNFVQGVLDMFIFSNGEDIKFIYSNTDTLEKFVVEKDSNIHMQYEGTTVKGLGLHVYDNRLWIFNGQTLFYSNQTDCRNFVPDADATLVTSAGYINFVKNITAIYPYLGSLAVFHADSSALVMADATTGFKVSEESPGGCASYKSLVFHGTDLYFYDDSKKGVFSFQQIVNGDKTLGDNVALDIQTELMQITDVDEIKALSVVTSDRNEVWFLLPISNEINRSIVMIFDYLRGEWIKRKCQHINTITIYKNSLVSAGKKIYEEYSTDLFDGEYIEHFYICSYLNFLSDTSLKITKFPPRISVDASYGNNFFVQYVKNYDMLKSPKIKEIKAKSAKNIFTYNSGITYNSGYRYKPTNITQTCKLPSANFKALQIKFYTKTERQDFCIKSLEFTKIKVKQI